MVIDFAGKTRSFQQDNIPVEVALEKVKVPRQLNDVGVPLASVMTESMNTLSADWTAQMLSSLHDPDGLDVPPPLYVR